MAEANNKEDQKVNEAPQNQDNKDKVSTPDELNAVKAQLEEEQKAKTSLEQAMAEKDARLAELDAALSEAKQGSEASATELAAVKEARDQAVTKYLGMAKASNPQVPGDMISGETIEEIDAAVEKGKGLVSAVKKTLESETAAAKVPAGAPTRGETTEGMSNKDMIAAGLRQKGGS
jgi:DNA repair exonuclease SbcCD ATPase subunit